MCRGSVLHAKSQYQRSCTGIECWYHVPEHHTRMPEHAKRDACVRKTERHTRRLCMLAIRERERTEMSTEREREKGTEMSTERERHTDISTEREREREREREGEREREQGRERGRESAIEGERYGGEQ
eukprot:358390-Rhodomonas_salina.1